MQLEKNWQLYLNESYSEGGEVLDNARLNIISYLWGCLSHWSWCRRQHISTGAGQWLQISWWRSSTCLLWQMYTKIRDCWLKSFSVKAPSNTQVAKSMLLIELHKVSGVWRHQMAPCRHGHIMVTWGLAYQARAGTHADLKIRLRKIFRFPDKKSKRNVISPPMHWMNKLKSASF